MLNEASGLRDLLYAPMRAGRVIWIGIRPGRKEDMLALERVAADSRTGLEGDHYRATRNGKRQVTLIQSEHLAAIASFLGGGPVAAECLRRNVVTEGINLLALKNRCFRIGSVVMEFTGECHPCSRMEAQLGPGGYNAVRGHGGITARIVESGDFQRGDRVCVLPGDLR